MAAIVRIDRPDRSISKEIIRTFFSRFGTIHKITLPKRGETHALVEFATTQQARLAIKELNSTTLQDIHGRKKQLKTANSQFIWNLSLIPNILWEENPQEAQLPRLEKKIVEQKKRNLTYIESLGPQITINHQVKQRPIIKLSTPKSTPHPN
ncbi:hypothetical protein NEHOM01_1622 [Nematocida homosporus]|uniref:uncharacterized protein n=1 Tax=Nematocida homosporus TaxID=1912981 RepID=UPI00221EEB04|nr:uncharacterized protein NEHOM01_1622 [Nematocida homosporus]KAI5186669.1 hypothetical protein NEHOM01_1622 [Nematocida homosporus]